MKILDAVRSRRHNGLDPREVGLRLDRFSQVELPVEAYERAHKNRPEVLDMLRYMRTSEFGRRGQVMKAAARVLATVRPSAGEHRPHV